MKGKGRILALGLAALAPLAMNPAAASAEEIKHSFFVAGPMTGIVGEDLEVVWDSGKQSARDGFVLPGGGLLICWADEVREYDRDKNLVWTYKKDPANQELGTAVRLPNGLTMITELGKNPRLLEVEPTGRIATEVKLQPETDNAHMQTRMARKLPNGNYLVPHLLAFKVKEYTPKGEVVKTFRTDLFPALGKPGDEVWPFTAIRLPDGNTHINLTHSNQVIEVDPDGKVVWHLTNADLEGAPLADPCGAQRLPNGNAVIASYGQHDEGKIKMFEVTRDKKIVWSQTKFGAHEFQILTTNGKPLEGEPMK